MSAVIEEYEQQYSQITAEATSLIGRLGSSTTTSASERRELIQSTEQLLEEAGGILEQIGLEIRDCYPEHRPSLTAKLNCYSAELKRLKNEFQVTRTNKSNTAAAVFDDETLSFGEDQRQRLLHNSERLERTGNHLSNAYRIAVETEEIGNSVLRDLENQRETLGRARSRLRETDAELGRSSRLLNTMIMRHMRDKFVLYIIGVLFILVICVSVYFSMTKSDKLN